MVQETERGAFSWREIITQSESWAGALTATMAAAQQVRALFGVQGRVLFIGCGRNYSFATACRSWRSFYLHIGNHRLSKRTCHVLISYRQVAARPPVTHFIHGGLYGVAVK